MNTGLASCHRGRSEPLAAEQEAAVVVGDGQRIAVEPVAGLELALEVRAPDIIGCAASGSRVARMADRTTLALLRHQAVAAEDLAHRRCGQADPSAGGAARASGAASSHPSSGDGGAARTNASTMCAGVSFGLPCGWRDRSSSPAGPCFTVTIDPLVAGLATDAVQFAQLGHRKACHEDNRQ